MPRRRATDSSFTIDLPKCVIAARKVGIISSKIITRICPFVRFAVLLIYVRVLPQPYEKVNDPVRRVELAGVERAGQTCRAIVEETTRVEIRAR